jgi:Flp pilus assembly protein TadG
MRIRNAPRRGMTTVESAVVYPVVFLFVIGLLVGSAGVLRYQEMASLARRAARYAAVHGYQYSKSTGNAMATSSDIYQNAIAPYVFAIDTSKLSYSVSYSGNTGALYQTTLSNGNYVYTTNIVTVTVSYRWVPEAFLGGITLSSTSSMPMSN